MRYEQIRYVPETQDPSLAIETRDLVAMVIDNTGLQLGEGDESLPYMGRFGINSLLPISHHLGYHGIRTLYDKTERRNLVVPLSSWFNLQTVSFAGIQNDPVDERAWAGVGRGWPIRLEKKGRRAALVLDEMPVTRLKYTIEFLPAEPDGIDIAVRFTFGRKADTVPPAFKATWPCYINAYDDVCFNYVRKIVDGHPVWAPLGEKPDLVIGEPVAYEHRQRTFIPDKQALPLGFGRIGQHTLILMFDDPRVRFFVVNAGGHFPTSAVQNPAWDISWTIEKYPLGEPIGFDGRIVYAPAESPEDVFNRYRRWIETR